MNKGRNDNGKKESEKARIKREAEEKLQQELRDLLEKLNVLVSIIPGGCTGYLQVLDILINKLIKKYVEEQEELWIEQNLELHESGKWLVGDRRVLCTH
jgi:uncharacterized membrane protein